MANIDPEISEILKFDLGVQVNTQPKDTEISDILKFDPNQAVQLTQVGSENISQDLNEDPLENLTWGEVAELGIENFGKSTKKELGSMLDAFRHPIRTFGTLKSLSKGFVKTGLMRSMAAAASKETGMAYDEVMTQVSSGGLDPEIEMANQVYDYFTGYFDSRELKYRIANDPAAIFLDALSIAIPATKAVGLQRTAKVLSMLDPVTGSVKAITQPLRLIPAHVPQDLYRRAVGFANKIGVKVQRKLAQTALDNLVIADAKGMLRLENKLSDLNETANRLIDDAVGKGKFVSFDDFYRGLDELENNALKVTDATAADQVRNAFSVTRKNISELLSDQGPFRTLREAQDMKSSIYKELQRAYDTNLHVPTSKKIRKLAAHNAKELLDEAIPDIKKIRRFGKDKIVQEGLPSINEIRGDLLELEKAIQNRAMSLDRSKIFGMGVLVTTGFGGALGYNVGNLLGMGSEGASIGSSLGLSYGILTSPRIRQYSAMLINKMRKTGITINPTITAMELGFYEGQKIVEREEQGEQE